MKIWRLTRSLLLACATALTAAPLAARPILDADSPPAAAPAPAALTAAADAKPALGVPPTEEALLPGRSDIPLAGIEADAPDADAYARMIDDILDIPQTGRDSLEEASRPRLGQATGADALMAGEEAAVRARVRGLRDRMSPLFEEQILEGESEEARELRLRQEIALKASGVRADPTVGLGGSTHPDGQRDVDDAPTRPDDGSGLAYLRIMQMLFLIWDTLTHPASLVLILLYALARGLLAIARMQPKRRRTRRRSRAALPQTAAPHSTPAPTMATETAATTTPRRSRHRRRRRGFFERLLSF
ncbi:MAG: hypothetical protein KDE68_01420 [Rhodocyclaceae bacterium]|nr:hypothetical protein [Rhodocyclaceae bacterium]